MPLTNDPQRGDTGSTSLVKALTLSEYAVATVPAAATHKNRIIKVSNGAAGSPCLAVSDGASWLRVVFGAAISATV